MHGEEGQEEEKEWACMGRSGRRRRKSADTWRGGAGGGERVGMHGEEG